MYVPHCLRIFPPYQHIFSNENIVLFSKMSLGKSFFSGILHPANCLLAVLKTLVLRSEDPRNSSDFLRSVSDIVRILRSSRSSTSSFLLRGYSKRRCIWLSFCALRLPRNQVMVHLPLVPDADLDSDPVRNPGF